MAGVLSKIRVCESTACYTSCLTFLIFWNLPLGKFGKIFSEFVNGRDYLNWRPPLFMGGGGGSNLTSGTPSVAGI